MGMPIWKFDVRLKQLVKLGLSLTPAIKAGVTVVRKLNENDRTAAMERAEKVYILTIKLVRGTVEREETEAREILRLYGSREAKPILDSLQPSIFGIRRLRVIRQALDILRPIKEAKDIETHLAVAVVAEKLSSPQPVTTDSERRFVGTENWSTGPRKNKRTRAESRLRNGSTPKSNFKKGQKQKSVSKSK